jgi:hypothetical protein
MAAASQPVIWERPCPLAQLRGGMFAKEQISLAPGFMVCYDSGETFTCLRLTNGLSDNF